MKNNLHLWICVSACLAIFGWGVGQKMQLSKWTKNAHPAMGLAWYEFGEKAKVSGGTNLPFHYEPFTGRYKTKVRFKILGVDRFYYSEPFTGYIDYGQFEEAKEAMSKYHYKMEEFKHFAPRRGNSCWAED
jgi:hypothetical protein